LFQTKCDSKRFLVGLRNSSTQLLLQLPCFTCYVPVTSKQSAAALTTGLDPCFQPLFHYKKVLYPRKSADDRSVWNQVRRDFGRGSKCQALGCKF
jgi:hypothetical protein